MKKPILMVMAMVGLFCFEARAERTVYAVVPILADNKSAHDSIISLFLSNPSSVSQTVSLTLSASGQLYFESGCDGSNLFTCTNNQSCSMRTQFQVLQPGESRQLKMRVRRTTTGNHATNQGVQVSIEISEDSGFILAAGYSYVEAWNGVAYTGGPFTINGGRPF